MIKFFRTIRQRMLKENLPDRQAGRFSMPTGRLARYFLYAVGEIVLVMVGILLALQVNNWNEARKQSLLQDTVMARLSEEFLALEPVMAELVEFSHSSRKGTAEVVTPCDRQNRQRMSTSSALPLPDPTGCRTCRRSPPATKKWWLRVALPTSAMWSFAKLWSVTVTPMNGWNAFTRWRPA